MCVVVIILFNVKDFRFPYREPDSRKFLEKHIYLICSSYFQINDVGYFVAATIKSTSFSVIYFILVGICPIEWPLSFFLQSQKLELSSSCNTIKCVSQSLSKWYCLYENITSYYAVVLFCFTSVNPGSSPHRDCPDPGGGADLLFSVTDHSLSPTGL